MTIEKLPSGHYRITKMVKGKRYRATLDHKPTKAEAEEVMSEIISQSKTYSRTDMTFQKAAEGYINLKSNVLSPSTIVGYYKMLRQLSDGFKDTPINDIDQVIIQDEINSLAGHLSPKSVINISGFISPVLGMYRPLFTYHVSLPQKVPAEYYIPTEEEVKNILDHVRGTEYYIPFVLGIFSLRRSEVCALELSDLEGNILHVHKAKVQNNDKEWIIKKYNKTSESHRDIYLPNEIAERIRDQGFIFEKHPERLYDRLCRCQDELGIKHFRLHDLRHYYVSYAHALGIPDEYIMKQGGWKTDHVMKRVYRHAFQKDYEEAAAKFASKFIK